MFVVITAVLEPTLVPATVANNAPFTGDPAPIKMPVVKLVFNPPTVSDVCKNPL